MSSKIPQPRNSDEKPAKPTKSKSVLSGVMKKLRPGKHGSKSNEIKETVDEAVHSPISLAGE